jgi:ribosomal protein L11 methyltransferase
VASSTRSGTSSADPRAWPALVLRTGTAPGSEYEDTLAALLDDFAPLAIQDLTELPLPPGGLWDPTYPPIPDPPPAPLHWRVFFGTSVAREAALAALSAAHPELQLHAESVSDEDWAARSQRALTAVEAGRFVIAPPWDIPDHADATVVIIEPSRGFGTGHHASTRLCLRALSTIDVRGKQVLDLGTGSGVLALAAALSGATSVKAVDVDPDAIESARHSAAMNPLAKGIEWQIGDFRDRNWEALSGYSADLVLANLTGGMLISAAARIRELLAPDGTLVCSGFDEREQANVERALDLRIITDHKEDGWVSLVFER